VLIESGRGTKRWRTVGASRNVVAASLEALVDGYEYGLRLGDAAGEEEDSDAMEARQ
jgi:2-isopropylmalate synthase